MLRLRASLVWKVRRKPRSFNRRTYISTTKILYGIAALPLLAGVAFAETPKQSNDGKVLAKQPMQLTEQQMDKVTAGWDLYERDIFNTGIVYVSIYERQNTNPSTIAGNTIVCTTCYLLLNNFAISVGSQWPDGFFVPAGLRDYCIDAA